MSKTIHLPGLNGLRAIAALSVMWGHTFQKDFGNWGVEGVQLPVVADGVTLFFVISGFLITYLLLNEQEQSHTVSIPKFYMRRVLRIWPIYYLYMLVAVFVTSTWNDSNMWYYCFFAANIPFILSVGIWPIVHYWSIGVEEQFYLCWPWLVKLTRGNNKRLLIVAIVVCVVWLTCKWGLYLISGTTIAYRFFAVTRFDCMMLGAVGAILFFTNNNLFSRVFQNRILGLVCFLLLFFSQPWASFIPAPFRPQMIAVLSLVCIVSQLKCPIINLENKLCDFVGKISYGIYVIHPLLIYLLSTLYRNANLQLPRSLSVVLIYGIVTTVTIFIAWISYRFFESPFLKMKNRFAIVQSRNSMKE
jgi:peptidoglycan/LPS O-acetylase OafA/YrhL